MSETLTKELALNKKGEVYFRRRINSGRNAIGTVTIKPMDHVECPCCLMPTLQGAGSHFESDEFVSPNMWWKGQCENCRTVVERYLLSWSESVGDEPALWTIDEQVYESDHGHLIRELREARRRISFLESEIERLR